MLYLTVRESFSAPVVEAILESAVAAACITFLGPTVGIALSAYINGVVSYAQTGNIGAALETAAFTVLSESAWVGAGNFLGPNPDLFESTAVHGLVGVV